MTRIAIAALSVIAVILPVSAAAGGNLDRHAIWRSIFAPATSLPEPPDNVATPEKIALGHDLFRDTRLSGDGTRSCATCHDPARAFTDGRVQGLGRDGRPLGRNTPPLHNLAWANRLFWDGRASSLEAQMLVPLTAGNEMAAHMPDVVARLSADAGMRGRFAEAFPGESGVSERSIVRAIAAYERSLVKASTRFDAWVAGRDDALSARERQGFDLFVGQAGCVACHGGWRFTDDELHDIGLPAKGGSSGSGDPAGEPQAFKTPSLRELLHTAPYMHDGSIATLEDVVKHYGGGLVRRPSLDSNIVRDLELSRDDVAALVAFLEVLSSGAE